MKVDDCFYFGKVGKAKGFKGDVNLIIDKDVPFVPESLNEVFVLVGRKLVAYPLDPCFTVQVQLCCDFTQLLKITWIDIICCRHYTFHPMKEHCMP